MLNTIAVYCAENWKLLLARTLLHFSWAMRSKKIRLRWLSSDARKLSVFSFFIISFHVAEKSVHISSRLLVCVCTFLLVDKIVYGLLAFGNACFSFCIKSFQIFSLIKLAWRMFVRNFGKISIFLAFSGSFAVKNDNFHSFFFAVLVPNFEFAGFFSKTKIHGFVKTVRFWPRKNQSEHTDFPKTGFAI